MEYKHWNNTVESVWEVKMGVYVYCSWYALLFLLNFCVPPPVHNVWYAKSCPAAICNVPTLCLGHPTSPSTLAQFAAAPSPGPGAGYLNWNCPKQINSICIPPAAHNGEQSAENTPAIEDTSPLVCPASGDQRTSTLLTHFLKLCSPQVPSPNCWGFLVTVALPGKLQWFLVQ